MGEILGPEETIEQYPEVTDDKESTILEGVPALKMVIENLYVELVLNDPDSQLWRNFIARNPFYSKQADRAASLFQKIFKETDHYLALRTGKNESGQQPPVFSKWVKDPMGWHEEIASLEEGNEVPIIDSRGEYVEIPNGWIHLTAVGQAIHQNGDLVLLRKESLGKPIS